MDSLDDKKDSLINDEDANSENNNISNNSSKMYTEEDKFEEWRVDLTKLEYEIQTLKSVLMAKHKEANELRRKLGITQMSEIKQDLQYGLKVVKDSNAFQKTSSVFKSFGSFATQKVGSLRNSVPFKSVEGKVGSAYTSVKSKLSPSTSHDGYVRELDDKVNSLHEPFDPSHPYNTPSDETSLSEAVKSQVDK